MDIQERIKKALENLKDYKSIVFDTDEKISEEELKEIQNNVIKSLSKIVSDKKALNQLETLILDSGEQIGSRHIEEAVKRIILESRKEEIEKHIINDYLEKEFSKYLESRNLPNDKINYLVNKFIENGVNKELKKEIKTSIIENLKANNYDSESINSIESIIVDEIDKLFNNIDIEEILKDGIKPDYNTYKEYISLPLLQIKTYDSTTNGIKQFGLDYGISSSLINNLLSNKDQEETLNNIVAELENHGTFLGNEQENKFIIENFKEEMANKVNNLNDNYINPEEALNQIYDELGIKEEDKKNFIQNIKAKGSPGKNYYKLMRQTLERQKSDEYARIKTLLDEVKSKNGKKVKKKLSSVNKKLVQDDYKEIIKMRQQMFNDIYNLNIMVVNDSKTLVPNKTYKIVNVRKAKDSKITNQIKKETIKKHINWKNKLKERICQLFDEEEYQNENTTLKTL